MTELGVVRRGIKRADRASVDALGTLGVATVHEAMGRVGLMQPYMRPIYPGAQVSGTAVTVLLHPGDNWMMHVAAEQIQPGDVVVAAITAECTDGYFGDLLATSFMARGARALMALSDQMLAAPLTVVGLGHEQSVPIFQQLARGHPSCRDDVREIPAVATQRRGSPGRAGDRHQP